MPSQRKVWCGITLVSFHEIFCVRNQRAPAPAMIWGSAAE
jgi:hypothetical protein